jgi:hypothetical protein
MMLLGMTVKREVAMAMLAGIVALGTTACADQQPRAGPESPSPTFEDVTTVSPGHPEFLAVFETAADPEDLESVQEEILEEAPENVAVSPAACWEEVPDELGISGGDYVAGVVAATAEELQEAVEAVGREPIFEGQVTLIACD